MQIEIKVLQAGDAHLLDRVAPDVFDNPIDQGYTAEFLADGRHHICVAMDGDTVVGFASGLHYVHPDKPPQLFVNEVGVTPAYRQKGIAKTLLTVLFKIGEGLGCAEAWVGTEMENRPARALYRSLKGGEEPGYVIYNYPLNPAK